MSKLENLIGRVFYRLTVLSRSENSPSGGTRWNCLCSCGKQTVSSGASLKLGNTKSCGCFSKENSSLLNKGKPARNRLPLGLASFNNPYAKYRSNAGYRSYCWELNKETFRKLTGDNCYYCGTPPKLDYKGAQASYGKYTFNGIDRKNNILGYTVENSVSCCKECNTAKSTMSLTEFRDWVEKIFNNLRGKDSIS